MSKRGLPLSGKIVLGVITVAAATGGFTLGYFVGKNAPSAAAPLLARQTVSKGEPSAADMNQGPNPKNEASSAVIPAGQNTSPENKVSEIASVPPVKASPKEGPKEDGKAVIQKTRTNSGSDIKTASTGERLAGHTPVPPLAKADKETAPRVSSVQESSRDASSGSAASLQEKVVYTVQAGAFRSRKDAEDLRHRLEEKGYKVSVNKDSNPKGILFYKVRAGEFGSKKEASLFAIKLKKTVGLNAFPTVKK